jgi:protein-tyrosine phosphatase
VFNVRDLGGIGLGPGRRFADGRVLRGDSFHRLSTAAGVLREVGVVRVLDLRDDRERELDGVLNTDGVEVQHHPVIDPTFLWSDVDHDELASLLLNRYVAILGSFGPRFAGAIASIAEVVGPDGGAQDAVAYHCAVGKDRTGLLTALLLGALGAPDEEIVRDYARSSRATAVQVSWLWSFGHPAGAVDDEDLSVGLWSARPETMAACLQWLDSEFGDARRYLLDGGLDPGALESLGSALITDVCERGTTPC